MRTHPLFVTWLALVAATMLSYLFQWEAMRTAPRIIGTAILAIAFFKVWLIGMRYMELREAVMPLRLAYNGWVALVGSALVVLFWIA